jgi:hypothetical protein
VKVVDVRSRGWVEVEEGKRKYVGRSCGGFRDVRWGNRKVGRDGSREKVVEKFEEWLVRGK